MSVDGGVSDSMCLGEVRQPTLHYCNRRSVELKLSGASMTLDGMELQLIISVKCLGVEINKSLGWKKQVMKLQDFCHFTYIAMVDKG